VKIKYTGTAIFLEFFINVSIPQCGKFRSTRSAQTPWNYERVYPRFDFINSISRCS